MRTAQRTNLSLIRAAALLLLLIQGCSGFGSDPMLVVTTPSPSTKTVSLSQVIIGSAIWIPHATGRPVLAR
ncbi:MAG: hypothetical protein V1799_19200 [bacterium]